MIICVLDLHKALLIVEVQMSVVDKSQHGTWVKLETQNQIRTQIWVNGNYTSIHLTHSRTSTISKY